MTTQVKKSFVELVEFLKANEGKKVSTIMPELMELVTAKQSAKNFLTDDKGQVTHVFCYYHKKWEAVDLCEYGAKKHSASGLNSMCKEGVNQWSKQQRQAKQAKEAMLTDVASGEIPADKINEKLEEIEQARTSIIAREDGKGSIDEPKVLVFNKSKSE